VQIREDRDLHDRGHEQQRRGLDAVEIGHRRDLVGTSAATASSEPRFA
jgi:hypothetical protein